MGEAKLRFALYLFPLIHFCKISVQLVRREQRTAPPCNFVVFSSSGSHVLVLPAVGRLLQPGPASPRKICDFPVANLISHAFGLLRFFLAGSKFVCPLSVADLQDVKKRFASPLPTGPFFVLHSFIIVFLKRLSLLIMWLLLLFCSVQNVCSSTCRMPPSDPVSSCAFLVPFLTGISFAVARFPLSCTVRTKHFLLRLARTAPVKLLVSFLGAFMGRRCVALLRKRESCSLGTEAARSQRQRKEAASRSEREREREREEDGKKEMQGD